MNGYFRDYGPEQREMLERWLDRMRSRFAGARDASDIGRVLARERHLETLNQPLPMSAQRLAKLESEVTDVEGEGAFLLVVDCGETGIKATRYVRRFESPGCAAGGQAPGRRRALRPRVLAQPPAVPAVPHGGRLMSSKQWIAPLLADPIPTGPTFFRAVGKRDLDIGSTATPRSAR